MTFLFLLKTYKREYMSSIRFLVMSSIFCMYNATLIVKFHFSWRLHSDVCGSVSDQMVVTNTRGDNTVFYYY